MNIYLYRVCTFCLYILLYPLFKVFHYIDSIRIFISQEDRKDYLTDIKW